MPVWNDGFSVDAFGFVQHADGSVHDDELSLDEAPLGLSPFVEGSFVDTGPAVVYISIDDVVGMQDRALEADVEILMPPTDQDDGSRGFAATDHEGNGWCFGTYRPGAS